MDEYRTQQDQWQLYTDKELLPGAIRWGLSVIQERERIRILQSNFAGWPAELKKFLRMIPNSDYPGVPTSGIDVVQWGVIKWLKLQPAPVPA